MDSSYSYVNPDVTHPEASTVSSAVVDVLRGTKGWTRFLSVLGYVSCGFMILAGLGMMASMLLAGVGAGSRAGVAAPTPLALMGVFYIVGGLIGIVPAVLLGRYASRIGVLVKSCAELDLVAALDAQRTYWKLIGIFAIVMVSLYLLGIISFLVLMLTGDLLPSPAVIW